VRIIDQQELAVIGIADPRLVVIVGGDAVGAAGGFDGGEEVRVPALETPRMAIDSLFPPGR